MDSWKKGFHLGKGRNQEPASDEEDALEPPR